MPDIYGFGQPLSVFPQPLQRVNQAAVADGAGGVRDHVACQFAGDIAGPEDGLLFFFGMVFVDSGLRDIRAAHAELLGQRKVADLVDGKAEQLRAVAVQKHGIDAADQPVHRDGVPAFLEGQVTANGVHDGELRAQDFRQAGNRLHQPQGMEAPLFRVGNAAFEVLQGAGEIRLAMRFQHGQVDEKIRFQEGLPADLESQPARLPLDEGVFFQIVQGNAVSFRQRFVAADAERGLRVRAGP